MIFNTVLNVTCGQIKGIYHDLCYSYGGGLIRHTMAVKAAFQNVNSGYHGKDL